MEQGLRAVVLGWQKSDKASLINSILGSEVESDKHFARSVRKDGEANGRKITLINTPCWWQNFGLKDSPEVVKQEMVCSVFLCPPGPHVFLQVINLSLPFTEENRLSIEKHLSLFGERIWRHTVVVFTRANSLTDRNIEQHIKNQDLQQIIQRCGERYHIFDFKNKSSGVQELLDKIDDVVAANSGKHFETHDDMLLEIKRKRDENEERAEARQKMLQDKRDLLKEIEAVAPLSELRIVLLGWTLSGKSSAGNTIFNHEIFQIGKSQKGTNYTGDVNGRQITVLDTPSWWKYFSSKFNPKFAQAEILESIGQSQHMQFPHAMILVIPFDTSFKNEQKRIIKEYMAILGEDIWRHTIVLFTWGDRFPDVSIEQHIESEGGALQWLIEKCRNRYHVFDNTDKKNRAQVTELLQKIDEMVAENSLFCLKTQCPAEVNVHETDTEEEISLDTEEEISLDTDHVLKLLYQEMNNRFKRIMSELKHLKTDFTECIDAKSDSSMSESINLSADEKLMEMIRREGSRWELILMEGFLNIQNPEASSDGNTSPYSSDIVLRWFERCNEYNSSFGCGTSILEDPAPNFFPEFLEDPEPREIKRRKAQFAE